MRRRNGTAPLARSPEAARRGRTWDHRAAGLCMNHVLTLPKADGVRTGRRPEREGGGLPGDMTYSGTCLFEPSVA